MRQRKPKQGEKEYRLNICLDVSNCPMLDFGTINRRLARSSKLPIREIAFLGGQNLYQAAEAIIAAFEFDFDHCFGFFDNYKSPHLVDSKEAYELFVDIGEDPPEGSKAVKKAKISQVFPVVGKKMLFYFDYGDNWRWLTTLMAIGNPESSTLYPKVIASTGEAPEQYPIIE